MRILKLTRHKRVLLKEMLNKLFSEFDKIKLRRNGTVVFWRNKWKFWQTETTHISELTIKEIPQRIERASSRFQSRSYPYWRPKKLQKEAIKIITGESYTCIIEFLWNEYTKVKFPINELTPSDAIIVRYSSEQAIKDGILNYRSVFNKHCQSLIRSPIINFDDILSHIKTLYKKKENKVIKLNLKRILDTEYFSVKQLMAA